ncbi:hypothetical protein HY947_04110 [Candidatus Gottesmanbacteria bacterium]|nr:hypothetical protein [Candidatus Gottesmanbacteria bacterium]
MYNWSHIDEEAMKREDPEKYRLWRLTQLINSGLNGEKLDREEVKAAWPAIRDDIEPYTRRALEFILWDTTYSLPTNLKWWMPYNSVTK